MKTTFTKKILSFLILMITVCAAFSQSNKTTKRRYALVIGNQNYQDYPLKTNIADAEQIAEVLRSKEFNVTFKKDLTSLKMANEIQDYILKVNSDPHSVSLIYFTGHAFTDEEKNYLLPTDNSIIRNKDQAKVYGIDLQSDIADKIYCETQLYIIDGAYDNPFKTEGTRALGVKGGLAATKSQKESTVAYLFSAEPNYLVLTPENKTSVFADTLAQQIKTSSANVDATFNTVKQKVKEKTNGRQIPYTTATTIDFSFNGNELIALQKISAIDETDKASIESISIKKEFEAELAKQNALKDELLKNAADAQQEIQLKIEKEKAAREELERLRKEQEEQKALERTAEENALIEEKRLQFEEDAAFLKNSITKNSDAQEKINYIESLKFNLYSLRQTSQEHIDNYNATVNSETHEKVTAIYNAEPKKVETDDKGNITEAALKRRSANAQKVRDEAEIKKTNYKKQKNAELEKDNKKWLPMISSAYKDLERSTYTATSLTDELSVTVSDYDGSTNAWKLYITSNFLDRANLFTAEIPLSYTEVTGEKSISIEKMNDRQLASYNDNVMIYDSLFRSATPVFYVKLTYKVSRWADASEYHILPLQCEVIRIGRKNKTVHTVKQIDLDSSNLVMYPQLEIRTEKEIESDAAKCNELYEKEISKKPSVIAARKAEKEQEKLLKAQEKEIEKSYSKIEYADEDDDDDDNSDDSDDSDEEKRSGRNMLFITINSFYPVEEAISENKYNLTSLAIAYSQSMGRFFFFEGRFFGSISNSENEDDIYGGSLGLGANANLGMHWRPFITGNVSICTNKTFGLNAGGGIDFTPGDTFTITTGFNYGWMHYFDSLKNGIVTEEVNHGEYEVKTDFLSVLKNPDYHQLEFYIGCGFAW
ncbi:MAG: caspase family protein [Treponema sp.]|nr:caspase family protein [Treponema sp.]